MIKQPTALKQSGTDELKVGLGWSVVANSISKAIVERSYVVASTNTLVVQRIVSALKVVELITEELDMALAKTEDVRLANRRQATSSNCVRDANDFAVLSQQVLPAKLGGINPDIDTSDGTPPQRDKD